MNEIEQNVTEIKKQLQEASKQIYSIISNYYEDPLAKHSNINNPKNPSGDHTLPIDLITQSIILEKIKELSSVFALISEENDKPIFINKHGKYIITIDPLDGSSNVKINGPTGTIFSIYQLKSSTEKSDSFIDIFNDSDQIAAGYALYCTALIFCFAYRGEVKIFQLIDKNQSLANNIPIPFEDASNLGQDAIKKRYPQQKLTWNRHSFIQTYNITNKKQISTLSNTQFYSVNEAYYLDFHENIKAFLNTIKSKGVSLRYTGALVSDFHRILLCGGVFLYPSTKNNPNGKLRLIFECLPMAFIMETIGKIACTDNKYRILDIIPTFIHQKSTLVLDNSEMIDNLKLI